MTQLGAGTKVEVISTKPKDPSVEPLILLIFNDAISSLSADSASSLVKNLRDQAGENPGPEWKITLKSGEDTWKMSSEAALRIAEALDREVHKVRGRT